MRVRVRVRGGEREGNIRHILPIASCQKDIGGGVWCLLFYHVFLPSSYASRGTCVCVYVCAEEGFLCGTARQTPYGRSARMFLHPLCAQEIQAILRQLQWDRDGDGFIRQALSADISDMM